MAIAHVLAGAWRREPPPIAMSAQQLGQVTPLLLETGAGALAWWRVRHTSLASSPAGAQIQQAYRMHALQGAMHARQIVETLAALRSAGVEPILAKGWAVAWLYPEPGLRPYGDIDLSVSREQHQDALAVLNAGTAQAPVDLKPGFDDLPGRSFGDQYAQSHLVPLGNTQVRVLGMEDHLRLLCLHLLRHGAWRPLWLCDIAVALESLPRNFDWDYFLSGSKRHTAWVVCVLGMAHCLLGASLELTPANVKQEASRVPDGLVAELLRRWESGHPAYEDETMMAAILRRQGVAKAIQQRWNPIVVGFRWRWPHSRLPALPYQVADFIVRTFHYVIRLGRSGAITRVGHRAA